MSNTITIELCQEDRQRLDELIAFAGLIVGELKSAKPPVVNMDVQALSAAAAASQEAPNLEAVKSDHPADEVSPFPEPEDDAPAEEVKPAVNLDQIRQKVTTLLADSTKKDAVRDIVKTYAPNVTGLAKCENKWPEIWDKLTALEG